jgi:hypothetical protein
LLDCAATMNRVAYCGKEAFTDESGGSRRDRLHESQDSKSILGAKALPQRVAPRPATVAEWLV